MKIRKQTRKMRGGFLDGLTNSLSSWGSSLSNPFKKKTSYTSSSYAPSTSSSSSYNPSSSYNSSSSSYNPSSSYNSSSSSYNPSSSYNSSSYNSSSDNPSSYSRSSYTPSSGGRRRRKRSSKRKYSGGYSANRSLNDVAFGASNINVKTAQPQAMVGGRTRRYKHNRSCKH